MSATASSAPGLAGASIGIARCPLGSAPGGPNLSPARALTTRRDARGRSAAQAHQAPQSFGRGPVRAVSAIAETRHVVPCFTKVRMFVPQ